MFLRFELTLNKFALNLSEQNNYSSCRRDIVCIRVSRINHIGVIKIKITYSFGKI